MSDFRPAPHDMLRTIRPYLNKYGEALPVELVSSSLSHSSLPSVLSQRLQATTLRSICVVPVFDEPVQGLLAMTRLQSHEPKAFVFVLNAPQGARQDALERTQTCRDQLINMAGLQALGDGIWVGEIAHGTQIWLLDYCSQERLLNPKQGVGLARKLGLDFALTLTQCQLERGAVAPSWLMSCDADVVLPEGYFDIPEPEPQQVASLYPIEHKPDAELELAMALYDFRLDYYVQQLKRAGSPYAFQTVGSAIAVTPLAYAQVRGMPKRAAGEDFYLLNKLAKLSEKGVKTLTCPVLKVAGRASTRVPFGTGPALQEIVKLASPIDDYRYYHPECFSRLRSLLSCAQQFEGTTLLSFQEALTEIAGADIAKKITDVLEQIGATRFFEHLSKQSLKTSHTQSQKRRFWRLFTTWFDGFKTLKFVHANRDLDCPNINIECLKGYPSLLDSDLLSRIDALLDE